MALDADKLAEEMINQMEQMVASKQDGEAFDKNDGLIVISRAIVNHIREDLEIKVPRGSFVDTVTGQAIGTANLNPVSCEVL